MYCAELGLDELLIDHQVMFPSRILGSEQTTPRQSLKGSASCSALLAALPE
jgi:hypothetical protein